MTNPKYSLTRGALVLGLALSGGCGDDAAASEDSGTGPGPATDGGEAGVPDYTFNWTLVPILAADDSEPIASPHEIIVLDSLTGEPLDPEVKTMSAKGSGKVKVTIPGGIIPSVHIVGNGTKPDDTYDSIVANIPPGNGDTLIRISQNGTATLAGSTSGVTFESDRAAYSGAVYWTDKSGRRMGAIGCAKIFLDDNDNGADDETDQRYSGASGLPTTIEMQDQTNRSGRFYFGNMTKGEHTMKVTLDDGKTFLGGIDFVVTRVREDALGPSEFVLYQIGIDIEADANPTPADCPM